MSEPHTNPPSTTSEDDTTLHGVSDAGQEQQHTHEQEPPRSRLFARLAQLGVAEVIAGFNGYGDSGGVEYMEAKMRESGTGLALKKAEMDGKSLYAIIEDLILNQLATIHMGWPNSAGAFGTYTLDVANRDVREDFVERAELDEDASQAEQGDDDRLRVILFNRLTELGVASVTVECEGGGDMGEVVSIELEMEANRVAPSLEKVDCEGKPIRESIEELVMNHLFAEHPGWELDCGSDSTYVLDVIKQEVNCGHFAELEDECTDED